MWNWYRGPADFGAFMRRIDRNRGERWQTAPLQANGELGFAAYLSGALHTVQRGRVARRTVYQDETVFDLFALDR